jgi:hypothetical protein
MSRARNEISIGELANMLSARAHDLAIKLLPLGHLEGSEWVEANRKNGGLGDSMRVCVKGPRAGVWGHFAAGEKGDALDLVGYIMFGKNKAEAIEWSKRWLGIDERDPAALEDDKRRLAALKEINDREAKAKEEETRQSAFNLWLNSEEKIAGTPVEKYLLGRGIDIRLLGRQPRVLRYHPRLFNVETQRHWPAMVAKIDGADGKACAAHRTWLKVHQDGSVTKAPLQEPKLTLGRYKGGCIRLWRGLDASGKPGKSLGNAPEGSSVVICEGIEDGLSLAVAMPEQRILVAVALSAMGSLELPGNFSHVTIAADNDGDNGSALLGLDRAIRNFKTQGLRVSVMRPPPGVHDVNEILQSKPKEDDE